MNTSFFLGANSGKGFYSLYNELINLKEAKAVYILKGCPGCGKSSLMKKIASIAEEKQLDVERIYCSSDPDSLDGIVIPQTGVAIVDGTAPHIIEPEFPLIVERYVDLGRFVDTGSLSEKRNELMKTKEDYSGYYKHIYRLLSCAEHIENELFDIALLGVSIGKLHRKAQGIISREIKKQGKKAETINRFLSSYSFKGNLSLIDKNMNNFEKVFIIEDSFGIGHFLLVPIIKACESSNLKCVVCRNPLKPERIEHIMIPELSVAFFTADKQYMDKREYYRKIRLDSMIDRDVMKQHKSRISLLCKAKEAVFLDAFSLLDEAKRVHDELEELYNPYIDFNSLSAFSKLLSEEIF